jgi:hypothetical protein
MTCILDDKSNLMTFIVDVSYKDVFGSKHRTEQCFFLPITVPMGRKLFECEQFKAVIE